MDYQQWPNKPTVYIVKRQLSNWSLTLLQIALFCACLAYLGAYWWLKDMDLDAIFRNNTMKVILKLNIDLKNIWLIFSKTNFKSLSSKSVYIFHIYLYFIPLQSILFYVDHNIVDIVHRWFRSRTYIPQWCGLQQLQRRDQGFPLQVCHV